MPDALKTLLKTLGLEPLEHNLFRGNSPQVGRQRIFGGQVIGQSLVAVERRVKKMVAHSLHLYFMRPVDLTHFVSREKPEPVQNVWFKATGNRLIKF